MRFNGLLVNFGVRFVEFLPRTTWAFVEAIVGFDKNNHNSPDRIPIMARNDLGGTGTKNLEHWAMNTRDGKFADYSGKEYDTSVLSKNLAQTDILLLVGSNDAFCQELDVIGLL